MCLMFQAIYIFQIVQLTLACFEVIQIGRIQSRDFVDVLLDLVEAVSQPFNL